ncbi:MAG: hypothetical protein WC998_00470 [Candidatus Paceibacterota bacterium]|jgi:hypothetical protein
MFDGVAMLPVIGQSYVFKMPGITYFSGTVLDCNVNNLYGIIKIESKDFRNKDTPTGIAFLNIQNLLFWTPSIVGENNE